MKKVAICIPCYNNEIGLKRLLDSIVVQKFKDFVIIITDDSDHDKIRDLIKQYSQMDINYYKNPMRLGVAGNTNQALKIACSMNIDYLKIMYHDDCFSSSISLEMMVNVLEKHGDIDLVFSNTFEIGRGINCERKISNEQIKKLEENIFNLVYENIIGAPSATIIRKNESLFDEYLKWFVDIDWYFRIIAQRKNFMHIDEPLITIGLSDTQLTLECINNPAIILDESMHLYRKYQKLHCNDYLNFIFEKAQCLINEYRLFQIAKNDIFIYGAGKKGKECASVLMKNGIAYEAFVVSDLKNNTETLLGHNVIKFSDFLKSKKQNRKIVVILALNEKNRREVLDNIKIESLEYIFWE